MLVPLLRSSLLILFCFLLSAPLSVDLQEDLRRSDASSQAFKSEEFLLKALVCFQAACRSARRLVTLFGRPV